MSGDLDVALLERLIYVTWAGADVVDLGCGTGRIGDWLRSKGARTVVGVDRCEEMMAKARQRSSYTALLHEDLRTSSLADESADLVVSLLCTCHLPDLVPFYREASRLLRAHGSLVLVDYHWHFLLNGIPTHFSTETGEQLAIENHIHLFSEHVRAARSAGFVLRELEERIVTRDWIDRAPGWRKHLGRPASFAMVWAISSPQAPPRARR
jgi:SAM-dependent methyltransferase